LHLEYAEKRAALKTIYDYKEREMKKMINIFLSGILCGVIMAAAATFAFAIPGNNNQWRVEVTRRGGGAWSIDKNGNFGWRWIVQPISEPRHSAIIAPQRTSASSFSHEDL
jgi:hypothetical protein